MRVRNLMPKNLFYILVLSLVAGCQQDISDSVVVYNNNFESNFDQIQGAKSTVFNGSIVLGNFNNNGFILEAQNLPDHEYVSLDFDLFIHDSWDGNINVPGGPDKWRLRAGKDIALESNRDFIFQTSFSNGPCSTDDFCLRQSYPGTFPLARDPRSSVTNDSLPGLCLERSNPRGTSYYRIQQVFRHQDQNLYIKFEDELVQTNTNDMLCDESWSVDNLMVTVWN